LNAFFPNISASEDDAYYFDEELRIRNVINDAELVTLDLSFNSYILCLICYNCFLIFVHYRIDEFGSKLLCYFLRQNNTVTCLDLTGNNFGDEGLADIISCFAKPFKQFSSSSSSSSSSGGSLNPSIVKSDESLISSIFGEEDTLNSVNNQLVHNYSVTELKIGDNGLAESGAEALVKTIKNNCVLRTLHLDICSNVASFEWKKIMNANRVYNTVLEEFSLADNPLTVKTVDLFFKIAGKKERKISRINLSQCNLKHLHIRYLFEYFQHSQSLFYLDLHNNAIGDIGANIVAKLIKCDNIPIRYLDLSGCGLSEVGAVSLMGSLSSRTSILKLFDLSHNRISFPTISDNSQIFFSSLSKCKISELRMNGCNLQSSGANLLFKSLSESAGALVFSLKCLYIAENDISDSTAQSLSAMLMMNFNIELLDLGFNKFTDNCSLGYQSYRPLL
jgi:Ran GTPase-activating protein (RanGAP) involved in mRNA processing and transport